MPKSLFGAYGIDFEGGKGFYSSIVESVGTLEKSLYKLDIVKGGSTKERVNKSSEKDCLKEDLSAEEIEEIVVNGNIEILMGKLKDECKDGGNISVTVFNNTLKAVQEVYDEATTYAARTSKEIMTLDSTGIYSDGIKENAPFDLILDIKDIDAIVFSEKTSSYKSKAYMNPGDKLGLSSGNLALNNNYGLGENQGLYYYDYEFYKSSNYTGIGSQYSCPYSGSSTSGLNNNSLEGVIGENSENSNLGNTNNSNGSNWGGNYKKVNDNSQFPCLDYFCINIDYKTHNSGMFFSSDSQLTIQDILTRSNAHLKQYASTSLIGSNITTNNFELGLKDINLPDMFHVGFQIFYKPAPILNVTYKEDKNKKENTGTTSKTRIGKDTGPFSADELIRFYYKTYGLDFERRNDLSLFKKNEIDRQININASGLTPTYTTKKLDEYNEYEKTKKEQRENMRRLIENQTKTDILGDFELQFKELEVFNRTIRDYTFNLTEIIKKMSEKPQDTGVN